MNETTPFVGDLNVLPMLLDYCVTYVPGCSPRRSLLPICQPSKCRCVKNAFPAK